MSKLIFPKRALSTARNFDGIDDIITVSTGNNHAFEPEDWTVALWVKLDTFVNFSVLFNNGDNVVTDRSGFLLGLNNTNKILVNAKTGTNNATNAIGTTVIRNGVWYYIAGTKSGTTLKLFLNAVEEDSSTTPEAAMDYTADDKSTTIGSSNEDIEADATIASVKVWGGVALTAPELALEMQGNSVRFDAIKSGGGWWELGTNNPEIDLSGNGNHGVLTGTLLADGPPQILRDIAPQRLWASIVEAKGVGPFTELSLMALAGQIHSFVAKDAAAPSAGNLLLTYPNRMDHEL